MAIHVTRSELKIKSRLLIALAAILGVFGLLYLILCHDGSYNEVKINTKEVIETTTAASKEEKGKTKSDKEKTDGESTTTASEEENPIVSVNWANYDALEQLQSESWFLTLVNSDYSLGKSYTPSLSPVINGSSITADSRVSEAYGKMYAAAQSEDVILTPYSAYTSYSKQQSNYDSKVNSFIVQGMSQEEATENALKRVDPGGCSENNAGLSVDINSASSGFASTNEYAWLTENAHKYGFVLRYPEDKSDITGKIYQPWHWRYVGTDAAIYMKEQNLCLEEYLGLSKES